MIFTTANITNAVRKDYVNGGRETEEANCKKHKGYADR